MNRHILSEEERQEILDRYLELRSIRAVESQSNYSYPQIYRTLRRAGVFPRDTRDSPCSRHYDMIVQMSADAVPLVQIADAVGVTHSAVRRYIAHHKIPRTAAPRRDIRGPKNMKWNGGRYRMTNGYSLRLAPKHPAADCRGYVYEHRLVMEERLGRQMTRKEVVHHIDHDPTNNDPENLQLFPSNVEHMRAHRQAARLRREAERLASSPPE